MSEQNTTIEELQQKLEDLDSRYLGSQLRQRLESTPFTPRSTVTSRIASISNLEVFLHHMSKSFPKLENDLTLRNKLDKIPALQYNCEPHQVAQLFLELEELLNKMSTGAMSDQKKFILLTRKLHPKTFAEMRADRFFKRRTEAFEDRKEALMEKAEEDWQEKHLVQLKKEKDTLHTIKDNPIPNFGKGKGLSREKRLQDQSSQSSQGKGKGKGKGKGTSKSLTWEEPRFKASISCKFCGKRGHYEQKCWNKFPQLKPTNSTFKSRVNPFPKPESNLEQQTSETNSTTFPIDRNDTNISKKRKAEILSLQGKTLILNAHVNGKPLEAIIDTGATISVVSKSFVDQSMIERTQTIPIEVCSGQTVFTLGKTTMMLTLGEKKFP